MSSLEEVGLPKQRMRSRRLVLVDIENVIGGAALHSDAVLWAKTQVQEAGAAKTGDHVVIGTSHIGLLQIGCTWTNLRYVVGSGPDGADIELLKVLDENVECRFGEIVLVSGDGIFTDKLAALAAYGLRVSVVAHPDGLSKRLRMAAHQVTYLTDRYTHRTFDDAA